MFSSKRHLLFGFLINIVLMMMLSVQPLFISAQSDEDIIVQADRFFQEEKYPEAMRLYSQLLSLHRNDPFYSYRFGVSMLYSDRSDPNATIKYIEAGLGKLSGDDAIMLNFHLATAYHLTFRFIEALRFYEYFKQQAIHKKFLVYNVDHRIEMCRHGLMLLQNIRDLYVFEKHHVSAESFFRSYNIAKFGGKLLVKPDVFKTKFDKKQGETTIIFLSDTQNVVYYSSYGRDGSSGKDIYRSFKTGGGWTSPERMSNKINTEFDEDYPFILPDGKTLYFSSKGHNSMGGYDVFRSVWDEQKKEWTEPVNLDFAINTPYDDILFVTDREEKYAYFSSVRGSGLNQINVFLVRIDIRPTDTADDLLAVVTDLSADVTDSGYIEAVQKIQQISNLDVNASKEEFDRRDNERRNQLYADNHKYNISDNPTDDELIGLTFQYAGDAERTFLNLRQKREAAELSADRYKDWFEKYSAEADKIYELALNETDPVRKKELSTQATELSRKAAEADLQYKKTTDLVGELNKSIEFQAAEYDKIMFRAGEIQRLASGRQIDTSVVLLKQLIDDIKVYQMNISDYIAAVFPTYEVIDLYNETIAENQESIQLIDDTLKNLAKEKELYQNELLLVKDPERKNDLLNEMKLLDDKIGELQDSKSQLNTEIVQDTEARKEAETLLKSPDYQILADVIQLEELMIEHPDSVKDYLDNTDLIAENLIPDNSELADTSANNSELPDTAKIPDNGELTNPVNNDLADADTTTDTSAVDTAGTYTANNNSADSTDSVTAENTSLNNGTNTQPGDTSIVENTISNPEDTLAGNHTPDTAVSIVRPDTSIYADATDSLNILSNDTVVTVPDNTLTEADLLYAGLSPEEKRNALFGIIAGSETPRAKTEELLRFFEEERAVLRVQKQQVNDRVSEIVADIETTENRLTALNEKMADSSLPGIERRRLEAEWNGLMNLYETQLIELDQLLMVSEYVELQLEITESLFDETETASEKIFAYLNEGNEKRATTELNKLTENIQANSGQLFTQASSVTLIVRKNAERYSSDAERYDNMALNAENKAQQSENKAVAAAQKAEDTNNESRKTQYQEEAEFFEKQAEIMKDSAAIYRSEASSLRTRSEDLIADEQQIVEMTEFITDTKDKTIDPDNPVIPESVDPGKMERMKMLIHENPWASDFSARVSESNQWSYSPDMGSAEPDVRITETSVTEYHEEIITSVNETENADELKAIADNEQSRVLKSSASIYITRIQQLDEQIAVSDDPATTIRLYNERDMLMKELNDLIDRHNEIAANDPGIELLTPETLPYWDELSVDPELSLLAMEKYMDALQHQLDSLNALLLQTNNAAAKQNLVNEIKAVELEMQIYNLKAVEIIAVSDRAESTLRTVVMSSIPFSNLDEPMQKRFSELDSLRLNYETQASQKMDEADNVKSMEQRKALYMEAYDLTAKSLEIQNRMFEMYMQSADSAFSGDEIAARNLASAVSNTDKTSAIVAESGSDETSAENTTTYVNEPDSVNNVSTATPPVEINNSTVVTDRTSENYIAYYSATNPVPEHTAPDGRLLFRVQFAASRRPAANDAYKGMNPIFYEQAGGWYRYMHGEFSDLNAATTARNQVRTMGFADAFVVAYYNGNRISIAEARNIMAAQPGVTYASAGIPDGETVTATSTAVESVTENIQFDSVEGFYYAVQVGVYGRPRTSQQLFGITPLIEERLANGNYRYMTGTYTSLDEANAARDRIRANGVPDAYVVVYRNGERISVRDAQNYITAGEVPGSSVKSMSGGSATTPVIPDRSVRAKNISFSVQIGAFSREIPEEVLNAFSQLAGGEVIRLRSPEGMYIYASGTFSTPQEAEELKIKLQNGGIPDAFVIAIEGTTKISLQEAKELLQIP